MLSWFKRLAAVALLAGVAACGGGDEDPTIAQTVASDSRFSILAQAVAAADLTPALSDPAARLTVFAPTNEAFAALLGELGLTQAQLLADKALLTRVLTYHVLGKAVTSPNVPLGQPIGTLQGGNLVATQRASGLALTDERGRSAQVTATDLHARNGVIHAIDRVVLPRGTVVEMARANPDFSLLVQALDAAGLAGTLGGAGPFTVFAPTNAAFTALLQELGTTKEALFGDKALLRQVLTYHVIAGVVLKADGPVGTPVTTLQSQAFTVDATLNVTDQRARRAKLTATGVLASNGVIHVLDRVILPRP